MAKSKPQEPDSSASKRKKHSSEKEVCVEENMDRKVKKKRKKPETEEEPPISALPQPVQDDAQTGTKPKNHKQPTEHAQTEKRRKKKRVEEEPPISALPQPVQDDAQTGTKPKNHKQPTEHAQTEKRRKKKRVEIAEPTTGPAVTQGEEEKEVVLEDLSPEERRVLERKMKKILKKNKLQTEGKAEGKVDAKPIAPQQALDYLTCWAENRKEWKFQKTRQTWLLQHMFDSEKVPDQSFSVLLSYLEGLRGAAKDTTVKKAETLVQEQGEGPEGEVEAQKRAQRAREVIQLLS